MNREDFVRLLVKHDPEIRAFLRSLLPTMTDVDEVMQNASVVAWRKFDQLDAPENFGKWMCVIARYEMLIYRRSKARNRLRLTENLEALIADEGVAELNLRKRQLGALQGCLNKLTPDRRNLIMTVYTRSDSMRKLAASFGKSTEAFYKIVSRLRARLLRCIETSLAGDN